MRKYCNRRISVAVLVLEARCTMGYLPCQETRVDSEHHLLPLHKCTPPIYPTRYSLAY